MNNDAGKFQSPTGLVSVQLVVNGSSALRPTWWLLSSLGISIRHCSFKNYYSNYNPVFVSKTATQVM